MGNNTKESSPVAEEDKTIPVTSSDIINLEIQDIEGIGPTTAKKLKEAGIVSVMDLAVTSVDELAVDINGSKESAATFSNNSKNLNSNHQKST
jgi:DNA repair protein RadA